MTGEVREVTENYKVGEARWNTKGQGNKEGRGFTRRVERSRRAGSDGVAIVGNP